MDATKILTADINDIIFDGRNKDYGAYDLRNTYNNRLYISLASMLGICLFIVGAFMLNRSNAAPVINARIFQIPDSELIDIIEEPKEKMLPKVPKEPELPQVKERIYTNPQIVDESDIREDDRPPEMEDLIDARIGNKIIDGNPEIGIIPPQEPIDKGIIEMPGRPEEDPETVFRKVEIESEYPGGKSAWMRYLLKTFRYPSEAEENGIEGVVIVQFIVDQEGKVSDAQVISGPKELWEEAVRVISKSGTWTPAIQNGRMVKSYKKQPIVFKLATE